MKKDTKIPYMKFKDKSRRLCIMTKDKGGFILALQGWSKDVQMNEFNSPCK